jgi:hypothetical protein
MKTLNFYAVIFSAIMLLASCEEPSQPAPPKNNGPFLESRLCGTWNSISATPHGVAPEYEKPYDCFEYKVIIDDKMTYAEYYENKLSTRQMFCLNDTIYDEQNNTYSGNIILEDSLRIRFFLIQDNLYLTPTSKGDDLIIGNSSVHYKKEF